MSAESRLPPPGEPDDSPANDVEPDGCGWWLTGCCLPRAVGVLIGMLIVAGILVYLALTGDLFEP